MQNPESMTTDQMRTELLNEHGYSPADVANYKGKQRLAIEVTRARMQSQAENHPREFLEEMEIEPVSVDEFADDSQDVVRPRIGSPDWQIYVMAHLEQNELVDISGVSYPKTAGLRRVAQVLLGEIVESGPIMVDAPKRNDCADRATVIYEIKIAWKQTNVQWLDLSDVAPDQRDIRCFREAADVWKGNTKDTYAVHPVATASTRAEGRALKKALQLNVLVAEEMDNDKDAAKFVDAPQGEKSTDGDFDEESLSSGSQKSSIKKLCMRNGIDMTKFLARSCFGKALEQTSKIEAASLVELLNAYQSKGKEHLDIPSTILVEMESK